MHPLAKAALGAVAAAYANETLVRPMRIAKLARAYSDRRRKPLLTFVPPPGVTLKSIITPSLALGDVNLHPQARGSATGLGQVGHGDTYRLRVPDGTFGAVFSWDVLEHLPRPDLALLEWHRVAERVFVIVPPWWTPEAWLNRWYIDPGLKKAMPLWVQQNRTIWLPSGQSRAYDAGTCRTQQLPRGMTRAPMGQQPRSRPPQGVESATPGGASVSSAEAPSLPIVHLLKSTTSEPWERPVEELKLTSPPEEESFSASPNPNAQPYLPPIVDGPSSSSVSSMMIISGSDFGSD